MHFLMQNPWRKPFQASNIRLLWVCTYIYFTSFNYWYNFSMTTKDNLSNWLFLCLFCWRADLKCASKLSSGELCSQLLIEYIHIKIFMVNESHVSFEETPNQQRIKTNGPKTWQIVQIKLESKKNSYKVRYHWWL